MATLRATGLGGATETHKAAKTRIIAEQTVTGIISDESNAAISGLNVLEKGTTNGVVSNENGKYLLTVKDANSILVFSYIGYITKEVKAGSISVGCEAGCFCPGPERCRGGRLWYAKTV
ncbi:carboxypeptidase-like regulatory domain-containing protein [Dyadobacter sp. CY327]|uniref:carboxypeptidase-like regulatory domain-containing protein n=1 Tax=Dyadobacter sp. CY327 TaxID=2907301 RepID=UPI001F487669|nr:carboxypeptidase-like regulatory domain-containing protein [Dyadobacter sp. CY327]MCE7070809.1 carboxypeptidase-like regulatory domain-containing protein [Dyadobacter sp. CY327]